jgi:hypothetical protein
MGLRLHRVLKVLPGVRVNLSKGGLSASLGPRGADVNIGRHGVTTNAGIPGTGLSYRSKLGTHGSWLGVVLLVGALAFWAGRHMEQGALQATPAAASLSPIAVAPVPGATSVADRHAPHAVRAALRPGPVYVHRGGSVLRDKPKASGHTLKKESKSARVVLVSESDGWAKVTDGNITGWMRASVLGEGPPE